MSTTDDVMVKVWAPTDLDNEARRAYLEDLQDHFNQCQGASAAVPLQKSLDPLINVPEYIWLIGSGSGVIIAAIKTLPAFLRARRGDVTVEVETVVGTQPGEHATHVQTTTKSVTVTATNTTDALQAIESALRDRRDQEVASSDSAGDDTSAPDPAN
ncbi:hypothetical protein [Nocardia cyriacigeorgica]|uniref:Uncharacterized protein n=1 Tax=Nocardia cyriacigeorgica TaxID=135487 RepID=A0A5R8NY33_9NOCA|nr:hypothetical protein [Nocardia cyriacigeorgica]TLF81197.1 hypothetical protein FEK34_06020 [Nocardia cyriacigeorgica]